MSDAISSVLTEERSFAPPPAFSAQAHIKSMEAYRALVDAARADPEAYWTARGREELFWEKPFERAMEGALPRTRWYVGGRTNLAFNCLDRHLLKHRDKMALLFEGEPGDKQAVTYGELAGRVGRLANALRALGVTPGDRVGIYLPLIPEAVVAMLACARIGAVHSVVFGGFSSDALRDRMNDAGAKVLLTADAGYRKGAVVPLLDNIRRAAAQMPTVEAIVVHGRVNKAPALTGREKSWEALVAAQSPDCPVVWVESEHPLFILYTSGSTGKPKGVLHTTAGYGVNASLTTRWVFDLKADDVYWCTADIGWVTGHTYLVYGPLMNAATCVLFEGALTHPGPDRIWQLIASHRISILYTAPTAIRSFMRLGDELPKRHDLSSLRLLGSVGEPINPEAWMWYRDVIGGGRCPIVDTWWQTETGGIMVSPLPGATATKPGSATLPLPGIEPVVLDKVGKPVPAGQGGHLFLARPWPSMLRTVWGDDRRFEETYFSEQPGKYFTGDGARIDKDGYLWVMGRVDDVVNVAGHRLGTAEIESALVAEGRVAEAAVVGKPDALKGTALVAFVTLKAGVSPTPDVRTALIKFVGEKIGAIARPDEIRFANSLPKTRSGKIMRRLLRDVAAGRPASGDVTTLEDLNVLAALQRSEDE
ncbi:MAG: acetate--CoA ligase [Myxococcaceae bacterium]